MKTRAGLAPRVLALAALFASEAQTRIGASLARGAGRAHPRHPRRRAPGRHRALHHVHVCRGPRQSRPIAFQPGGRRVVGGRGGGSCLRRDRRDPCKLWVALARGTGYLWAYTAAAALAAASACERRYRLP